MSQITYQCRPATNEERELTALRLRQHTEAVLAMHITHEPFGLLAHDGKQLVGSIVGKIFFNWLHVDLIWVEDGHRRKGVGAQLMKQAEQKAREANLDGVEVWTQSWQAPDFYRKLGYEEFAVIDDFAPGRKRHAFRRYLKAAP